MDRHKVIRVYFYATSSGKMPVREWLLSMPKEDRIEIGGDIANVEYHGLSGLQNVNPSEMDFSKYGLDCPAAEQHECFFLLSLTRCTCFMDSSRNPEKFLNGIWIWLGTEKMKWRTNQMVNRKHVGQSFDNFLQEEGIYEQAQTNALKKPSFARSKT